MRCLAILCAFALSTACGGGVDADALEELESGEALGGRSGLDLYPPDEHDRVLEELAETAAYWGRAPEAAEELRQILLRHDARSPAGKRTLFDALSAFQVRHQVFTETQMKPGLVDLRIGGDEAIAYRVGENPGGTFREKVHFRRVGDTWYRSLGPR